MNNEKQKTAIDFAFEKLANQGLLVYKEYTNLVAYQEAKEMEKEQQKKLSTSWAKSREQTRETAMHIGFASGFMSGIECYEDYYEELNRTQLDEDEFTRNYIVDRFEETYRNN